LTVSFNHMIVFAKDKQQSASFLAGMLGLEEPVAWGPFVTAELEPGVFVQFADARFDIQAQHYAFLVSEEQFDSVYQRILDRGLEHWADPQMARPGKFNTSHGGRGVYFRDPAGHGLEVLTRPYGSNG
jgi:catechol 2,3-dioxygenase-like lactoylglutathione lyase family enzyme